MLKLPTSQVCLNLALLSVALLVSAGTQAAERQSLLSSGFLGLVAASAWQSDLKPNNLAPTAPKNVSVEQAIRIVRRATGGRVLAATPSKNPGRVGVNVRILLDGERVSTVFVDANGRIARR